MTNTYRFAKKELDLLFNEQYDTSLLPFKYEILALCEKFGMSGQSGGSAPVAAKMLSQIIEKLCLQEPITPLTGHDDEWMDVSAYSGGEPIYQNKRCYSVFKNGENGRAYYIDAFIKKNQHGNRYSGSLWLSKEDFLNQNYENNISPRVYIKSFPFKPKTFYIDVIEVEVEKDNFEMYVTNKEQIDELFKYYDRY